MNISVINGTFDSRDAIDILTQIIMVKIKFHEEKINHSQHEEDIKMREKRIRELQNDLSDLRKFIRDHQGKVSMHCSLEFSN
ncbi:MAG TPA: hypothetical protein VHD35_13795 [Chitinophagaceae bacterium]|nr:hypothetical protein [Chitinophagaceae bacterium]